MSKRSRSILGDDFRPGGQSDATPMSLVGDDFSAWLVTVLWVHRMLVEAFVELGDIPSWNQSHVRGRLNSRFLSKELLDLMRNLSREVIALVLRLSGIL